MSGDSVRNGVAEVLSDAGYNRQRLFPDPKDQDYPHLSDIRLFLDYFKDEQFDQILDYGCGGSPYRPMFKARSYLRADYVDSGNLDYVIGSDGKVAMPDNFCDAVISTQVLEHVFSPDLYLSEALRVLRPGGRLILTTHGIWEDHGCPFDFRRWTYDGLLRDIEESGFQIVRAARMTTGPRAALFLLGQVISQTPKSLSGIALRLLFRSTGMRHKWMDRQFADNRLVFGNQPGHRIYLALGVEAIKQQVG